VLARTATLLLHTATLLLHTATLLLLLLPAATLRHGP
jgi:hypothetical protein